MKYSRQRVEAAMREAVELVLRIVPRPELYDAEAHGEIVTTVRDLILERDAAQDVAKTLERGGCWTPNPHGVELSDWDEVAGIANGYPDRRKTQ